MAQENTKSNLIIDMNFFQFQNLPLQAGVKPTLEEALKISFIR